MSRNLFSVSGEMVAMMHDRGTKEDGGKGGIYYIVSLIADV